MAEDHEKNIRKEVQRIEREGQQVDIWWSYSWPKNYTRREYERQLLKNFLKEHGKLPLLNKRI